MTPSSKRGLTLAEVVITLAIVGMISAAFFQFTGSTNRLLFDSAEKLMVNKDIRTFSEEMVTEVTAADQFYIYPTFDANNRDDAGDRQLDGQTGDFIFLLYMQPWPANDVTNPEHVTRIVGFFRQPDATGKGPVYKFEENYNPGSYVDTTATGYTPETLITHLNFTNPGPPYSRVVELSRGLASASGDLFYNYWGRAIMVKGEFIHGNDARRITDTYNFTVSPKG